MRVRAEIRLIDLAAQLTYRCDRCGVQAGVAWSFLDRGIHRTPEPIPEGWTSCPPLPNHHKCARCVSEAADSLAELLLSAAAYHASLLPEDPWTDTTPAGATSSTGATASR